MPRVPRLPVVVAVALAFAGAACDRADDPSPSGSPPPTTGATTSTGEATSTDPTSPPPSPSASPTPDPDVRLPAGVAPTVDEPADLAGIAAGDLAPLVPPGASYQNRSTLATPDDPFDQIVLTWLDGALPEQRSGLIVWQRIDATAWRAVYAFTDPARTGVLGIRVETGDLTGDRIPDVLSVEDVGGSGACGTYRVIASTAGDATGIFRREVCDTQIAIVGGDLRIREAVFEPDDPHCCPSAVRTMVLRWNGTAWERVSSETEPLDPAGR